MLSYSCFEIKYQWKLPQRFQLECRLELSAMLRPRKSRWIENYKYNILPLFLFREARQFPHSYSMPSTANCKHETSFSLYDSWSMCEQHKFWPNGWWLLLTYIGTSQNNNNKGISRIQMKPYQAELNGFNWPIWVKDMIIFKEKTVFRTLKSFSHALWSF